jgi:hypothetical protein
MTITGPNSGSFEDTVVCPNVIDALAITTRPDTSDRKNRIMSLLAQYFQYFRGDSAEMAGKLYLIVANRSIPTGEQETALSAH